MSNFKFYTLLIAVTCFFASACVETDVQPQLNVEKENVLISLSFGGEITDIYYEPLRSSRDDNDLYGIQVYYAPDVEPGEDKEREWSYFAYGLFNDVSDIKINLLKGYVYKFVASMVTDGVEKLSNHENKYNMPFYWYNPSSGSHLTALSNTFTFDSVCSMSGLGCGETETSTWTLYERPNTERFYGELDEYRPKSNGDKAKIKMKRTSFGAKFIAKGKLANEGIVTIQIPSAPTMTIDLSAGETQVSDIFTFKDVYSAWVDNKHTETLEVNIVWKRKDNTIVPFGTHEVTYKRNATTVVNIQIDNSSESRGMGVEIPESEQGDLIEDGDLGITIKDGEVVDTEVETNK